jgi:hypothetical protein
MKVILLILLLQVFAGNRLAAQNPMTLTRGSSFEVALKEAKEILTLDADLRPDLRKDSLFITLKDVKYDKHPDNTYITAFNGIILQRNNTLNTARLLIPIRNNPPLNPGAYMLSLQLRKVSDSASVLQPFQLTITVKNAVLRLPSTVIVTSSQFLPWFPYKTGGSTLKIQEQSGNAFVEPISIRQVSLLDAQGQPVAASLNFDYPKNIEPAKESSVDYKVAGDLRPGKVIGTFEVVAPQLADPVPLRFEITTKQGAGYLLLTIIASLVAGYFIRIALEKKIALNSTRLKGWDLVSRIELQLAEKRDFKFHDELDRPLKDLKTSLESAEREKLDGLIITIDSLLQKSLEEFFGRQQVLQGELNKFSELVNANWAVPQEFSPIFNSAVVGVQNASSTSLTDIGEAEQNLKETKKDFQSGIADAMLLLKKDIVNGLIANRAGLDGFEQLKELLDQLLAQLPQLTHDSSDFKTVLESVQEINLKLTGIFTALRIAIHSRISELLRVFTTSSVLLPAPGLITALKDSTDQFLNTLLVHPSENTRVLNEFTSAYVELTSKVKAAVISQLIITATDPAIIEQNKAVISDVTTQLNSNLYKEAGLRTLEFLKGLSVQTMLSEARNTNEIALDQLFFSRLFLNKARSVSQPFQFRTLRTSEPTSQQSFSNTSINLLRLERWRTLILGALITFIGWLIFSTSFVGTTADFASVFFWAFTLDISMATLTNLIGRVAKPT